MSELTVYNASAGSGKTFTLSQEYVWLLIENPQSYRNILAITFTNKATSEMKTRILNYLYDLGYKKEKNDFFCQLKAKHHSVSDEYIFKNARIALDNIIHDYSYFNVQTIDSFLQKIMRNMTRELGIGSAYNITLSEDDITTQSIERLIESTIDKPSLYNWYLDMVNQKMDDAKTPDLKKELSSFSKNLNRENFWLYQHKIEEMDPKEITNFKNKAETYISAFWERIEAFVKQYDALAEKFSLQNADFHNGVKGVCSVFRKLKAKNLDIFTATVLKCIDNKKVLKSHTEVEDELVALFLDMQKYIEENITTLHTYEVEMKHIGSVGLIKDILQSRTEVLNEGNMILLSATSQILSEMISAAGAVDVPFIYEKISARLTNIMIDEMQDTSRKNWDTLKPLLLESLDTQGHSILLGDVKQSIYRWRNASWQILKDIDKEISHRKVNQLPLIDNYRSTYNIVNFNNELFTKGIAMLSEELRSKEFCDNQTEPLVKIIEEVFKGAKQTVKKNIAGIAPEKQGQVRCFLTQGKYNKTQKIEQTHLRVKEEIEYYKSIGYHCRDIALLFRFNNELQDMAEYLNSQNYEVVSDMAFAFDSSESVQYIINVLRYLALEDNVSLFYLIGEENKSVEDSLPWLTDREELLGKPLFDLIVYIIESAELDKQVSQIVFVTSFCDRVQEYIASHNSDIRAFLQYWEDELKDKKITIEDNKEIDALRLYTIYKAKGLEYPVVIVPYSFDFFDAHHTTLWLSNPQEKNIPAFYIDWNNTLIETSFKQDYYEEKVMQYIDSLNLMYVAFTRPTECLSVFGFLTQKEAEVCNSLSTYLYMFLNTICEPQASSTFTYISNNEWKAPNSLSEKEQESEAVLLGQIFHQNTNIHYAQTSHAHSVLQNKGIILHDIMSNIYDKAIDEIELNKLIAQYVTLGELATTDIEWVKSIVQSMTDKKTFSQSAKWFDGSYRVLNETSIVSMDNQEGRVQVKKPDRIMITPEGKAIIVDYKFTTLEKENKKYILQVKQYAELLRQMGVEVAEAYLWFIDTENLLEKSRIEKVI